MSDHDESPVLRPTLVELDEATCWQHLRDTVLGRIGFVSEQGNPMVLPVNYVVDEDRIAIRTSAGLKLGVAERLAGATVAFEIDEFDHEARTGWSVVALGPVAAVLDTVQIAHLDRIGHHTWADDLDRTRWITITPTELTGRRVALPDDPELDHPRTG